MECRITTPAFDTPSLLSILLDDDKIKNEVNNFNSKPNTNICIVD